MPLKLPRTPDLAPPPAVDRAIAAAELAQELSAVEVQEWLEPIGNTGFYQSPLEPVDPWNCDRWPDSPYCEGSQPFNPDFINLVPQFTRNRCETCITIAPTLARLSLPPYTICKRSSDPECIARPTNPDFGKIPDPENFPQSIPAQLYNNTCTDGSTFVLGVFLDKTGGKNPVFTDINEYFRWYHSGENVGESVGRGGSIYRFNELYKREMAKPNARVWDINDPNYGSFVDSTMWDDVTEEWGIAYRNEVYFIKYKDRFYSPHMKISFRTRGFYVGVPIPGTDLIYSAESCYITQPYDIQIFDLPCEVVPPRIDPTAPPYRPGEPCCMACCDSGNAAENTELLRLIAKRLGTDEFPASVPKSLLTDRGKGQQTIESLAGLVGWFVQQVDALVGEFPIDITIEDTDPTQKGNQKEKVRIPNIAEAIAEMYGLALKNSVDSDVAVSFLMRLAAESIATKNAALIAQDYARANAQFLGYKGNSVKRKIPYAFNPEGLDSLETILRESEKFLVGWQMEDSDTLLEYQQRLMFAAGIIKAVFFRGQKNFGDLEREISNLTKGPENEDSEERWREYLRAINNADHRFNTGNVPKPKIKDLQVPEDVTKLPTKDPTQK